jgi:hypothetical protein
MLLKLTSSAAEFSGKSIVINSEYILSILENDVTNENGLVESKTFIFCPPHGTWEVKESLETVLDLINQGK